MKLLLPLLVERIAIERKFYTEIPTLLHPFKGPGARCLLFPCQHALFPYRDDPCDRSASPSDDKFLAGFYLANASR